MNARLASLLNAFLVIGSCLAMAGDASAVTNLLFNRGLEDVNPDLNGSGNPEGDGWGNFGATDFNAFFGANGHASLFADTFGNEGGVFQLGIPAVEGATYQFDALDTRIEAAFDADLQIGLEFYAPDDTTQIGPATLFTADTAARLALPNVDGGGAANGAVFSVQATAPVGAGIVRPIIRFDNVNFAYLAQPQANAFVFNTFLSEVPAPGGNLLKNPAFDDDSDDNGATDDVWGFFGNTGVNDFFGGNVHASFFADTFGNEGGVFQQSILGDETKTYRFTLEDVRIEDNFDADLRFGLEYYAEDDFTKLGEEIVSVDTSTTGDGLSFSVDGTPVAGTFFVRPIILFDDVNPAYLSQPLANAFVFETSLAEVVDTALPGDADGDGDVDGDDLIAVQTEFGATGPTPLLGDADSDGDVDGDDLIAVQTNFGDVAAVAVPEPASVGLLGVLAGFGACSRRRV